MLRVRSLITQPLWDHHFRSAVIWSAKPNDILESKMASSKVIFLNRLDVGRSLHRVYRKNTFCFGSQSRFEIRLRDVQMIKRRVR
jgi:hypothetical protein